MALTRDVYRRRLDTVRQKLGSISARALLATPSSNLYYLTGIRFDRSERLTALLLFADREPVVVCPAFEESRLRGMSAVDEVRVWQETEDPFRLAAGLLPSGSGVLAG